MEASHLRQVLKRYLQTITYFSSEARHNILNSFDENVAKGNDVVKVFNYLVEEWGNDDPQDLLATYHSKASLDEPKTKWAEYQERQRKRWKMDGLAFEGLRIEDSQPKANSKPLEKQSPDSLKISIGRSIRFKDKPVTLTLEFLSPR